MLDSNKIKTLLEKINWLTNSFEDNNYKNISALEKSLLKEKVLMFFDEIENIPTTVIKDRTISQVQADLVKPVNQEVIEEKPLAPVVEAKVLEPIAVKEEIIIPEPIVETPELVVPQVLATEPVREVVEPVIEVKEVVSEPIKNEAPEPQIAVIPEPTQLERFQKMEALHKEVSAIRRDLREIIDLNKSFIFKAELFNQSNDLYNQFINEMNTTRTEDNAFILLNNWTMKMNWKKDDNKAFELLEKAVEKRFLPLLS